VSDRLAGAVEVLAEGPGRIDLILDGRARPADRSARARAVAIAAEQSPCRSRRYLSSLQQMVLDVDLHLDGRERLPDLRVHLPEQERALGAIGHEAGNQQSGRGQHDETDEQPRPQRHETEQGSASRLP
jgi:hypothetical protein